MVSDWPIVSLGDVAADITVGHVGPMASEYQPTGIPFLRSQDIKPYRLKLSGIAHISEVFHARLQKSALKPGDVVIVRTGKPGTAAVIPESLPIANCSDLVIVRPGKQLDSRFLVYYVNSLGNSHVASHLVGAVQQHFNVGSARQFKIALPHIDEQHAIGSALGNLDDKIALNERMNDTLETIGRAIFKSWFVDFDPVKRKAAGQQPAGLSLELAALFPKSFIDSSLGKIPAGWEVRPIGDVTRVVGGSTPRTEESSYWQHGTIGWATPKDLAPLTSPILLDTERNITEQGLAEISSGLLPRGSVLLSSRAPIGYLAVSEIPVAINQGFIGLVCERDLPNYFVLNWVLTNIEEIKSHANGTTFLEISKANFRPLRVAVPPQPLLKEFIRIVDPLYGRMITNLRESAVLAQIRDDLLPKLITGEIRVHGSIKSASGTRGE